MAKFTAIAAPPSPSSATPKASMGTDMMGCLKSSALMLAVMGLFFFILSPGVLLTLPPGDGGVFASQQTSYAAAAVHTLVFVAVIGLVMCLWKPSGGAPKAGGAATPAKAA